MGFLARLAVAIAASAAVASAQTYTACDPLERTCPDDPALSGKYFHNYATSKAAAPDFTGLNAGSIFYQNDGAHFRVAKKGDAPTLVSNFYFMYGRFEVKLKSASGQGIVSSIVMQSDVRDEIDWELLGGRPTKAQTNYFGKGNTQTYDRMIEVDMADNQAAFHTYTIDWTPERVQWIIDGGVVRTLTPGDVKGDFYPQTPMQARIGNWAGGDSGNQPGTIEWAGGLTDYSKGPFDMIIEHITVTDYSTGKFYRYTDNSGSAKSIIAVDGKILGGDKNTDSRPPLEDKPDEPEGGNTALPTTSLRAPSNSGRVVSSTSSSTSPTTLSTTTVRTTSSPGTTGTTKANTSEKSTPTPTGSGSSDSSDSSDLPDPTAVVPEFNNPLNNIDTEKSTIVKQTAAPSSPHSGTNTDNKDDNKGDAGNNDNAGSDDPESAAPKAVASFALVAFGLISSAFLL